MVHHAEGCERMVIGRCQDDAMRDDHTNTTTTSETVIARQCREVRKQGLDVTTPETSNAITTNSNPVPSDLRDVMNEFNIVTYRRDKAILHTAMLYQTLLWQAEAP